ncbi:hypothetical protein bcere0013_50000 [Bacillus cereus BDRD-ST26]|uniref:Uncharacterized protein n=1 Tax=Bacillus cereus (strain ATCC 10987 / NRS 248) TaxID=222523 RepID=Q72XT1_BACC1|nr:hypothetical protein BCE_5292 [Bacillus cereus ATCC 10987]EEK97833.1 hypothetical protein bcere0013_50000 [Bacillus cereus BDRD-ST26]
MPICFTIFYFLQNNIQHCMLHIIPSKREVVVSNFSSSVLHPYK